MEIKPKQKYKPSPGGRIEVRFQNVNDKEMSDAFFKEIEKKTGMKKDKIIYQALFDMNKKYDNRGNLV